MNSLYTVYTQCGQSAHYNTSDYLVVSLGQMDNGNLSSYSKIFDVKGKSSFGGGEGRERNRTRSGTFYLHGEAEDLQAV
jgi:hypothetical protein